ncbi:MAG TPA: Rieske 2Fe-2S domain-containing protein [Sphingobacteriaceae bacterium]|nr:Rieske 2Fe-2S domain-containing protein [Sphingobacteriaceae bacterium]
MKRDEFLTTFGIGLAAVCTGCLASCGKGDDPAPTPGPGIVTPPPTNANTTLNLSTDIRNVGDSKVLNGIIIVRLAATDVPASFTAVQVACTHQGTSVIFNTSQGNFVCPNHGSIFSTAGVVQPGFDAKTNLKVYNIAISGTTMTIKG